MRLGVFVLAGSMLAALLQTPAHDDHPVVPLKHGPLDYYQHHCARCHGADGGAYDDGFTKTRTEPDLRQEILSMSIGQGGSELKETPELDAQVAYHYAIDTKKPFITWTGVDGQKVMGEVTPDTKLTASAGELSIPVVVKGKTWSLELPSLVAVKDIKLTAKIKDQVAILDLSHGAFVAMGPPVAGK